jgi:hypothetical protein
MFMYDMELKYKKCIEMIGMVFVLCVICFSFCNLRIEIPVTCYTSTKTTNRTIIGSSFFLHHRRTHKKIIVSSFFVHHRHIHKKIDMLGNMEMV